MNARIIPILLLFLASTYHLALAQSKTDAPAPRNSPPLEKRNTDKAIQEYTQAVAKLAKGAATPLQATAATKDKAFDPRLPLLLSDRAAVYLLKGNYTAAISDLDWALALNPSLTQAWLKRGIARYNSGDLTGAYTDFTRTIEMDDRNAIAFLQRGQIRYSHRNFMGAYADLQRALEIDANYLPALLARGLLFRELGQFDRAIADLTKYLQRDPRSLEAYNLRGLLWKDNGKLSAALEDFDHALSLHTKIAELWCNRGNVRLLRGDLAGALADYDRALLLKPVAMAYNNRAVLYRSQGRLTEAFADLNQAIQVSPTYAVAYFNRGQLWQQRGDQASANQDFLIGQNYAGDQFDSAPEAAVFTYDLVGINLGNTASASLLPVSGKPKLKSLSLNP